MMVNALRTILMADDSVADAEMATRALGKGNLANAIAHVEDGVEALDWLLARGDYAGRESGNPAVVLLDTRMPRMDQLDILRHMRAEPSLKHVSMVILTSSHDESDLARRWDLGVNAYVVKFADAKQFFEAVQIPGTFLGGVV